MTASVKTSRSSTSRSPSRRPRGPSGSRPTASGSARADRPSGGDFLELRLRELEERRDVLALLRHQLALLLRARLVFLFQELRRRAEVVHRLVRRARRRLDLRPLVVLEERGGDRPGLVELPVLAEVRRLLEAIDPELHGLRRQLLDLVLRFGEPPDRVGVLRGLENR